MQRGSALVILILIGLIIIFGGGYFYFNYRNTPQSFTPLPIKPKATLATYTNKNLGLEFKYPKKNSIVKEDSEEELNKRGNGNFRKNFTGYVGYEPGKFLGAVVVLDKNGNYDTNPFSIWVFDNADDLTINSWFDKYWYYPFLWGVFDYTSKGHVTLDKEETVSGLMAKYKIVSYQPGSPKYVYILKNKKMYLFRIIGEDGERILDSFKFLQ